MLGGAKPASAPLFGQATAKPLFGGGGALGSTATTQGQTTGMFQKPSGGLFGKLFWKLY